MSTEVEIQAALVRQTLKKIFINYTTPFYEKNEVTEALMSLLLFIISLVNKTKLSGTNAFSVSDFTTSYVLPDMT